MKTPYKVHCEVDPCKEVAVWDGPTNKGFYAAMCEKHYKELGSGMGWSKPRRVNE